MLRVNADEYVQIGRCFESVRGVYDSTVILGTLPPPPELLANLSASLPALDAHCEQLQLPVTQRLIRQLAEQWQLGNQLSSADLKERWNGIERSFVAELQSRLFMLILPHRVPYLISESSFLCGNEIMVLIEALQAFPNAVFDMHEAGNCFACERFTACVYHQMRVAEYGLIAVADSLGIPETARFSWDRLMQGIQTELKRRESIQPKPADWHAERQKYSDICSWFATIKNGWRNPVSHVPRIYSEQTARGLFSALHTLFGHLKSYGIQQVQMPQQQVTLPSNEAGAE